MTSVSAGGATSSDHPPRFSVQRHSGDQTVASPLCGVLSLSRSRWLSPSALSAAPGLPSQSERIYPRHTRLQPHPRFLYTSGMKKSGLSFACPICSKTVYRCPSLVKRGAALTCGRKCRAVLQRRGSERECLRCKSKFYARKSQIKQGYANYCSKQCFAATTKTTEIFQCVVCSGRFEKNQWQIKKGHTLYCSRVCTDRFRRKLGRGRKLDLFTNWQKREWMDNKCATCGSIDKLELDHIVPRFAGGTAERSNAQTLCRTCNRMKFWIIDLPKYRAEHLVCSLVNS